MTQDLGVNNVVGKDWYQGQLDSLEWFIKRDKILNRDNYACTNCANTENLQVHHLYYVNGKNAWDYPNNALTTLCEACHQTWHETHKIEIRNRYWNKNTEYHPPYYPKQKKKKNKNRKKTKVHIVRESTKKRAEHIKTILETYPSHLHKRVWAFLKSFKQEYEVAKIYYYWKNSEKLGSYFIANYYIPKYNIVINCLKKGIRGTAPADQRILKKDFGFTIINIRETDSDLFIQEEFKKIFK